MSAFTPSVLKLASFNTYLVSKRFNNNLQTYPERRAVKINNFLRHQDITFCQEVWGSGLSELTRGLDDFQVPPNRTLWSLFCGNAFLDEMFNTLYLHFLKTGGLYDVAKSTMTCRYRKKHTFTKSRSKSLKGVEATLWDVSSFWGPSKSLLVFNTHTDPWVPSNRKLQVQEIVNFVGETLKAIDDCQANDETSKASQRRPQDWANTGVLVVGDLNTKAETPEYRETLMSIEGWIDLFQGEKRHTYASSNALATFPDDYGRLDYIFRLERYGATHKFMPLKVVSKSVREEAAGEESSDHYALQVELLPG